MRFVWEIGCCRGRNSICRCRFIGDRGLKLDEKEDPGSRRGLFVTHFLRGQGRHVLIRPSEIFMGIKRNFDLVFIPWIPDILLNPAMFSQGYLSIGASRIIYKTHNSSSSSSSVSSSSFPAS